MPTGQPWGSVQFSGMLPIGSIAFEAVCTGSSTKVALLRASESLSYDFFYYWEVQVFQEADRIFLNLN